jgi:class 3 adenylate cyclase
LVVTLNEQQDYFGQTVNVAARVQGLTDSQAIFASCAIVDDPRATALLASRGLTVRPQRRSIRGVNEEIAVYEIP